MSESYSGSAKAASGHLVGSNASYVFTPAEAAERAWVKLQNERNGLQHLVDERNGHGPDHAIPVREALRIAPQRLPRATVTRPGGHSFVRPKFNGKNKPDVPSTFQMPPHKRGTT